MYDDEDWEDTTGDYDDWDEDTTEVTEEWDKDTTDDTNAWDAEETENEQAKPEEREIVGAVDCPYCGGECGLYEEQTERAVIE